MPKSRTRYQRAAVRSRYRKPKRKHSGSFGWNVAIASVMIVGVVAVLLQWGGGGDSASGVPPRAPDQAANIAGDHWHTAFQVDICGEWLPAQPQFEKPADNPNQAANVGIHTHGDNLIHVHPFVVSEEGNNATLGKYADYGGWSVSSDSIDAWAGPESAPKRTSWSNGDACPFGQYKGQPGRLTWAVDGKARTGDPSNYKMANGQTLAIYFLPKGAEQPFPPAACNALRDVGSVDQGNVFIDKGSPCNDLSTATTAPGETTTTTTPAASSTTTP